MIDNRHELVFVIFFAQYLFLNISLFSLAVALVHYS